MYGFFEGNTHISSREDPGTLGIYSPEVLFYKVSLGFLLKLSFFVQFFTLGNLLGRWIFLNYRITNIIFLCVMILQTKDCIYLSVFK